jgi:hypothetical protein
MESRKLQSLTFAATIKAYKERINLRSEVPVYLELNRVEKEFLSKFAIETDPKDWVGSITKLWITYKMKFNDLLKIENYVMDYQKDAQAIGLGKNPKNMVIWDIGKNPNPSNENVS